MPDDPRSILLARRRELLSELTEIEHDLDEPAPKDWEDAASERQGDEVLEALGEHDLAELRQIDAALERVADGSYGECVQCAGDISAERLHVLPATPLCKDCAARV